MSLHWHLNHCELFFSLISLWFPDTHHWNLKRCLGLSMSVFHTYTAIFTTVDVPGLWKVWSFEFLARSCNSGINFLVGVRASSCPASSEGRNYSEKLHRILDGWKTHWCHLMGTFYRFFFFPQGFFVFFPGQIMEQIFSSQNRWLSRSKDTHLGHRSLMLTYSSPSKGWNLLHLHLSIP